MSSKLIISAVNPKFFNYTRPLLLALSVGSIVVTGTIALFYMELTKTECTVTYPQNFGPLWSTLEFVAKYRAATTPQKTSKICLARIQGLTQFSDDESVDESLKYRINMMMAVGSDSCSPPSYFMAGRDVADGCFQRVKGEELKCESRGNKDAPCLADGCDGSYVTEPIEWCQIDEFDMGEENEREYELARENNGQGDICERSNYFGNPMPYLTDWRLEVCTSKDPVTAFGIASGYQGYIELAATIALIVIFTSLGILHSTDKFNRAFAETVKGVVSDTGSSSIMQEDVTKLVAEVKQLRTEIKELQGHVKFKAADA